MEIQRDGWLLQGYGGCKAEEDGTGRSGIRRVERDVGFAVPGACAAWSVK